MAEADEVKYEVGRLYQIDADKLQPDPEQPRKHFDEEALEELANSIREKGILQPILFRQDKSGSLLIVAGERRYRAAQMTGLRTLPAIRVEGDAAEISVIENLIRQNLTAIEEAEALQRILETNNYKQEELAKVIGKAPSTLSEILSINRLPAKIKDECRANSRCPRRILVDIARKNTRSEMMKLYNIYKKRGLTSGISKERKKGEKRAKPKIILYFIGEMVRTLDDIKIESFSGEDRQALYGNLINLQVSVAKKIKVIDTYTLRHAEVVSSEG